MRISLAKDVQAFLEEQQQNGSFEDPSAFVNDALRSIRDQGHKSFKKTAELESWLLGGAEDAAKPLTGNDFETIRKRLRRK